MTRYVSGSHEPCPHAVRIELDGAPEYRDGAPVLGRVVVSPAHAAMVHDLVAELQVHVHGNVNAVAVLAAQSLFRGAWQPGAPQSYAFSLPTPNAAKAYYGHSFNMELRVAAVLLPGPSATPSMVEQLTGTSFAELMARAYPAAACPVRVAAEEQPLTVTLDPHEAHARLKHRGWKLVGAFVLLLLALGSVGLCVVGIAGMFEPAWAFVLGGVLGALSFAAFGALILRKHLGAWFAERRIGIPRFAAHTVQGSHVDVWVELPEDDSATSVHGAFLAIERTEDHSGSGVSVSEQTVRELPFSMSKTASRTWGARLPLSTFDGMPSVLGTEAARVRWDLQVSISLPRWPDWTDEVTVDAHRGRQTITPSLTFLFD